MRFLQLEDVLPIFCNTARGCFSSGCEDQCYEWIYKKGGAKSCHFFLSKSPGVCLRAETLKLPSGQALTHESL